MIDGPEGAGVTEVWERAAAPSPAETSVPVHPLIADRWSPRALDPDAVLPDHALRAVFEAARWAPSFGNTQPARYLLGRRGDAAFDRILSTLTPRNRSWAQAAGALVLGCAVVRNAKGEVPYREYGLALATENLVLQAVAEGIVAHQMAGFDRAAARDTCAVPDDVEPVIVIALGRPAAPGSGGEDAERDQRPRARKPLSELVGSDWSRPAFD